MNTSAEDPHDTPADEDLKAKFRAALDKKHGETGANATPNTPGSSAVPSGNDKHTRMFRRKSGG